MSEEVILRRIKSVRDKAIVGAGVLNIPDAIHKEDYPFSYNYGEYSCACIMLFEDSLQVPDLDFEYIKHISDEAQWNKKMMEETLVEQEFMWLDDTDTFHYLYMNAALQVTVFAFRPVSKL